MRNRISRVLAAVAVAALGASAVSCGGAGHGGPSNLVLVSFNLPNIAGVALNQPLIFQFSDDVDPTSVTPDTIQVVGSPSFTFETIQVDGNLVAELPFIPNFEDYSDSGMAAGKTYTVFLPIFPAVNTVRSTSGRPLAAAESFSFVTNPIVLFVEARRPLLHAPFLVQGDEEGCVQNQGNVLFNGTFQPGTSDEARLLCLKNDGPPHVLVNNSIPTHDERAVGIPSAVNPGLLEFPAVRVRFNEPLDPLTVVPYSPSFQLSVNVQLWRVGDIDGFPITPVQIKTNKPLVVQNLQQTEVILVAVNPEQQGTYVVNIQGVKDLSGKVVDITDRPVQPLINPSDPYAAIDNNLPGKVPPGYRIYFRTLEVPATAGAISESFGANFFERTNQLFTKSTGTNPVVALSPPLTLTRAEPGQSTSANWNGAYRLMAISTLEANTALDNGGGRLKAVFEPYLGNGSDTPPSAASNTTLSGDDGDGVFEFDSFTRNAGTTLALAGSKPVLILVRGSCTINGTINGSGGNGTFGIDTDGTAVYTLPGAIDSAGVGGVGVAGGGNGGRGGPQGAGGTGLGGDAEVGVGGKNIFGENHPGGGSFGFFADSTNGGGGGGGHGAAGTNGAGGANAGAGGTAQSSATFARALASFSPDRCFMPNADASGGSGGGGGAAEDDNGASETGDAAGIGLIAGTRKITTGDDGGGGGGAGGGAIWIMARSISLGSTAQILMRGGNGGDTWGPGQRVLTDPDNMVAGDEFVSGINPTGGGNAGGLPTGQGGGGGGGAGGAILLQARDSLILTAGSVLDCSGGAGGRTGSTTGVAGGDAKQGGAGAGGRIGLFVFQTNTDYATVGTLTDASTKTAGSTQTGTTWQPTVDQVSQGVSAWTDLLGINTLFDPAPLPVGNPAFWTDNFDVLTGAPNNLVKGPAGDFDFVLEVQGATGLDSLPNPTTSTSLTPWTVHTSLNVLSTKQYIRYRGRFYVKHGGGLNPAVHPMPTIFDLTIPFKKT